MVLPSVHLKEKVSEVELGFPGGSSDKEPPAIAGDASSIPGLGRSLGEGTGNPLQYSCNPGESHGQRSLAAYKFRGPQESHRLLCARFETHTGSKPESHKLRAASN